MGINLFNRTLALLGKALDLRARRHNMILSNIANQDTPGYKSRDLNFKKALADAFNEIEGIGIVKTDKRHISPADSVNNVGGSIIYSSHPDMGIDRNSVNIEEEMGKLAENGIMYNAAAQILSSKLRELKMAIREGGG
ncbi:MAG: flagellar basal body rod protein FlgB [Nitrospirota bacterium]